MKAILIFTHGFMTVEGTPIFCHARVANAEALNGEKVKAVYLFDNVGKLVKGSRT